VLSQLDFKLLLSLSRLLKHRSVSLAADEMNMSQPAMSRSLAKLRAMFNDPLFVRTSNGMQPTTRALSLEQPLNRTLEQLNELVLNKEFLPKLCNRNFRLHMSSYTAQAHLSDISDEFYRAAPKAQIEVIDLKEKSLLNQNAQDIDLVLCSQMMKVPETYHRFPVGQESSYCFMAKNHPLATGKFALDDYLRYSHIVTTLGGGPNFPIETTLSKLGKVRKVGLRSPHYLAALEVLSRSQMLFSSSPLVPDRFREQFSITSRPLPFMHDTLQYALAWPPTVHNDPAQQWFRKICGDIIKNNLNRKGTKL